MRKNLAQKLLIILLLIATLSFVLSSYNTSLAVTETSDTEQFYVSDETLTEEELLEEESQPKEEEKILKYNAKTGETTEIDMEEVRENIINSYSVNAKQTQTQTTPTHTTSYDPYASKVSQKLITPRSTYTRVTAYSDFPYRITCRLIYDVYGATGIATGFLVGPNLLLTAAHCVMNMNDGDATFADWKAYPGYNNGSSFGGYSAGWSEIIYSSNWKGNHGTSDDWCLCILEDNLGSYCGWNGCQSYGTAAEMVGIPVRTVGYAGSEGNGRYQYYSSGSITSAYSGFIYSSAMSTGGMSGGPTMRTSDNYVVAINRGHTSTSGVGVRIHQTIIDLINERS